MLFRRPLIIESALTVSAARAAVRAFATSREMPELEAFRRRQIIGWRLSTVKEDFLFQPEYGDILSIEGARFIGLVEAAGSGSRVRGHVVASPLTSVVTSLLMIFVVVAAVAGLGQGRESATKILAVASAVLAAAVIMIRYSLWSTSRDVEARLRQCLTASTPRVAA
jgi:hypothetical protein